MLFLNSTRSRLYADTKWGGISTNWKIRNKIKFEINRQHEGEIFDGRSQGENRISRWTMVHAVDLNLPIASKLNLFTGFKFRYRREWDSQSTEDRFNEHHIIS